METTTELHQRLDDLKASATALDDKASGLESEVAKAIADGEKPEAAKAKAARTTRAEAIQIEAAIPLLATKLREAQDREAEAKRLEHAQNAEKLRIDAIEQAKRIDKSLGAIGNAMVELNKAIAATNLEIRKAGDGTKMPDGQMMAKILRRAIHIQAPDLAKLMNLEFVPLAKRKPLAEMLGVGRAKAA